MGLSDGISVILFKGRPMKSSDGKSNSSSSKNAVVGDAEESILVSSDGTSEGSSGKSIATGDSDGLSLGLSD